MPLFIYFSVTLSLQYNFKIYELYFSSKDSLYSPLPKKKKLSVSLDCSVFSIIVFLSCVSFQILINLKFIYFIYLFLKICTYFMSLSHVSELFQNPFATKMQHSLCHIINLICEVIIWVLF